MTEIKLYGGAVGGGAVDHKDSECWPDSPYANINGMVYKKTENGGLELMFPDNPESYRALISW